MAYQPWNGTSLETQYAAFEAADAASTAYGRSKGGFVRLARVTSSVGTTPYVVSVRRLNDGTIQFGCNCPNWIYRRQSSGTLCKHQRSVLTGGENHRGHNRVWYYRAGQAFLEVIGLSVEESEALIESAA